MADMTGGKVPPLADRERIRRLTHQSSLREKVFEALLLGQLGVELLERGTDFAVLHSTSDRDGYDVVIESGTIVRHIQLKTTVPGTATRKVPINNRLASKPSGCVVWMVFDPATRSFAEFRWFGAAPGESLPDIGDRPVRHSRANRHGTKAIRTGMRSLTLNQFERLDSVSDLADRLFGREPETVRPAERGDWPTLPCPDAREAFELPLKFNAAEAALIRQGTVPHGSDGRWFLFVEGDQLYCHRSWTGACIYGARLVADGGGYRLADCWVTRDASFESDGIDGDREAFSDLLFTHLLQPDPAHQPASASRDGCHHQGADPGNPSILPGE